jgi:hypothetical protein
VVVVALEVLAAALPTRELVAVLGVLARALGSLSPTPRLVAYLLVLEVLLPLTQPGFVPQEVVQGLGTGLILYTKLCRAAEAEAAPIPHLPLMEATERRVVVVGLRIVRALE